jgi:RNA polymerase sigma factor (sigma-70 family)
LTNLVFEQDLLQRLINNDVEATKLIYKENYPIIRYLVVNNSGDEDEAKDIFQEALIVLFEKAKKGNFELQSKISTYLYSVARRLWLKKLQSNSSKSAIADHIEETVAVEDDVEFHENQNQQLELMHEALAKIGEPCKSLLEAYYFNKQQMNDIANQFGYTNADNAKNQKYKCLVRLKKLFFAQHKNL